MSLTKNAIANYAGQGYSALTGIIVMPLYLQYLGAEAFGLIGFFIMLQAWMLLFDLGISPTLARQVALRKNLAGGFDYFDQVLRIFELIFLAIGISIAAIVYLTSDAIAVQWIDSQTLSPDTIAYCITLMGGVFALRLFASLYQSGIRGLEDQVWLNTAFITIVSLKFVGALLIMIFVSTEIRVFFQYQVIVGLCEVLLFATRFYRRLHLNPLRILARLKLSGFKEITNFALSIAYTAGIWVVITQTDKLILSTVLPLNEFGYFSLVSLFASGILIATTPIAQAILPRMTSLFAQQKQEELLRLYRSASQLVVVISVSISFVIAFYSEELIYTWTGDRVAAAWSSDVLLWFALGNAILTISAFQYYLQNSFGQLRLHVIGATISAVCQVPVIYYCATRFGAIGAGMAWFAVRAIWFLVWTPVVHRRLIPGFHWSWISRDLLPIVSAGLVTIFVLTRLVPVDVQAGRLEVGLYLLALLSILLLATASSSSFVRLSVSNLLVDRSSVS
jgi:O-antigen/teichoic acid export membrane protein